MIARDSELLARFIDMNDEVAFSHLVDVYGGLVLGAARRVTGETEAAKEAAQNTFITLARKAPSLRGRDSLGGWLHHAAMLSARNIVRSRRREEAKRRALESNLDPEGNLDSNDSWTLLQPALDASLAALPEKDRNALVLRFYRGCSVQEVASAMKSTVAAAQKRLGRAMDKLRGNLQRRGVTLSVPALTGALGLWVGESQCAAACSTAWAAKASASSATSLGSSWTLTAILTTMTNSKITTLAIVAVLLAGGGAIAWNKATNRDEKKPPPSSPGGLAQKAAGKGRTGKRNETADRLKELELEYGAERMGQVRRIIALMQAGQNAELEMTLMGLSAMSEGWLKQSREKWGLGSDEANELGQLLAREQDGRIKGVQELYHQLGERRAAANAEAFLLADKVARGDATGEEFEGTLKRLSTVEGADELMSKMGTLGPVDIYFLNEEFAASVEKLVPVDRREQFRLEVDTKVRDLVDQRLGMIRQRVPDLSEQQAEELAGYIRKSGMTMPQHHAVEEFLTEAQNEAWRDQDAAREDEMAQSTTRILTTGPVGEPVVMNAARTRSAQGGQIPIYLWQDPMTLDEIEAEARKLSRGGLIEESSRSAPVIRRVESGN